MGIGGVAVGPGASLRAQNGPAGPLPGGGAMPAVAAAAIAPAPRLTREELLAREQRNQMRDLQKALRLAAKKEEDERREREEAATFGAPPAVGTTSLALAAAAYGAPVVKKTNSAKAGKRV